MFHDFSVINVIFKIYFSETPNMFSNILLRFNWCKENEGNFPKSYLWFYTRERVPYDHNL